MKSDDNCGRKDMEDLKIDIVDTANTSKEIVQNKFRDVKTETKSTLDTVDENIKGVVKKTQDAAADVKKGSLDVAHTVKETAVNVARTVTASAKEKI